MGRDFNKWLGTFRKSISDYKYYVDFPKVYANVEKIKIPLNLLNALIGSANIEDDFLALAAKYPETLKAIPILIAKRESEIIVTDESETKKFDFKKCNCSLQEYAIFMRETGVFDLLQKHIVNNLVDYVTGVESGLDSNGRKNRTGKTMARIVENYLKRTGFVRDENYFPEMYIREIENRWTIDLSAVSNNGTTEKRFDFVVKTPNKIYCIEVNFYTGKGSKLNETARSYKTIALETKEIDGVEFVWFTDGAGWRKARNNLQETFDAMEHIYNIADIEAGIMEKIFV